MKTLHLIIVGLMVVGFMTCNPRSREIPTSANLSAVDPKLPWSQRMAETLMIDYPDVWQMEKGKGFKWAYTKGLACTAFIELWKATGKQEYFLYAKSYADTMINEDGVIYKYRMEDYNIDKINPGKMLFDLFDETRDPRYEMALKTLRQQLVNHPRTSEGAFWHKKRYPHQMWLDGLYMGAPFYARYGKQYNEPESIDEVINWIVLMEEKARDPKTGLLYHAWDESREQQWADKETGQASQFWSRGVGWYVMALVDVLDYAADHPRKDEVVAIINRLAEAVVKVQDNKSGVWYQVLDRPDGEGNYLEGSGSAMFTYFLLKAVRNGYIDSSYLNQAKKAYQGIIRHLMKIREDGRLVMTPICAGAGLGGDPYRDGSYEYYINEDTRDNDPKGVGPFIMASLLYEQFEFEESSPEIKPKTYHEDIEIGWKNMEVILDRIKKPVFAGRVFNILDYGAVNGDTCTEAFRQAILTCHEAGGGRVLVPKGDYISGAIHLLSNVELRVSEGASIRFSTDPKDYLPVVRTRFEGTELYNYSPLIYAYQQENIAITGQGVLDGQASFDNWWSWKHPKNGDPSFTQREPNSNPRLLQMMTEGIPVEERIFGDGHFLRPSFVQPYACKNVLIEGVTIKRPLMWMIHPVLSENIIVRNVKLSSPEAPNGDGCNPEACKDVLIESSEFNTGDDCIAIKSGRNRDGYEMGIPTENVIIRNCKMKDGHGGVVMGSETSGGVRNVYAYNCEMSSPNLERAIRLKSNKYRGGVIENIFVRDIVVGQVKKAAIRINQNYRTKVDHAEIRYTTYRNIFVERMTCQEATYAIQITGLEQQPIENLKFIDCDFKQIRKPNVFEYVNDLVLEEIRVNGEQIVMSN